MAQIAVNKKAYFDYQILEDLEAGLVLQGPEIKAIRDKRVNIAGSYIKPFPSPSGKMELWWIGGSFSREGQELNRTKKLLLHQTEIERLVGKLSAREYTILPLELYLTRGIAKLKIGLAVRKKKYDKRELIKKRDIERDIEREFKPRPKG